METILLTKSETAQALNLSPRMIDHLIARGELHPRRIGKRVLIAREELLRFSRGEVFEPDRANAVQQA